MAKENKILKVSLKEKLAAPSFAPGMSDTFFSSQTNVERESKLIEIRKGVLEN